MYNEQIMERFAIPKNSGRIVNSSGRGDAIGEVSNHGDSVRIDINVDDKGVITEAKFKAMACVMAIATCDVVCDLIVGQSVHKAAMVTPFDISGVLGPIEEHKLPCVRVAISGVVNAVKDYEKKVAKEGQR